MAKKREKTKTEKAIDKEEKQRKILDKLGFIQMVFDFYTSPVG